MGDHAPATATTDAHGHGHGHGHHDPNLAHHFDTMDQQVESGKLGMWLFLATEVLLFAGLFCAYTVYRGNHPEIFHHAHFYLSKFWGGVNTIILLLSSFTMALAVRASSMGQQKNTLIYCGLTVLGAIGFLGVKTIEYKDKFAHGTLWGARYAPHGEFPGDHAGAHKDDQPKLSPEKSEMLDYQTTTPWATTPELVNTPGNVGPQPKTQLDVPAKDGRVDAAALGGPTTEQEIRNVHQFFGIYFVMTGLHGLHVIIGMCSILWIMWRTSKGHFSPGYYLPVDLVGLYWHLVDLVWIYLFPLLYLIA